MDGSADHSGGAGPTESTTSGSGASDVAELDAVGLIEAYGRKELSPVEATKDALDRISAQDGEVNAFCLVDADSALEQARASEERWRQNAPLGPVDGVPTAIKDLLLTTGWPTLRGSRTVSPDGPWEEDAPSVARLRESGAVFVGKTTTPEFGWKGVTDNPLTGVTRNPHDPSKTAGGSSGGSATAVARGMSALALGTDGGGSIRIPAGFSGIFGLKPTYGRVPLYPATPFGALSHVGPMTRTVRDSALMLDVISRTDARDWSALPPVASVAGALAAGASEAGASETAAGLFMATLSAGVAGQRIAFSPTLGYATVDPEVADAVARAVDVLADLGAIVEEVDPGFDDPVETFRVLWYGGAAKLTSVLSESQRALMDPGLQAICAEGAAYSLFDYLEAMAQQRVLGVLMGRFHETYDLLVTPALPIPAFEAGVEVPAGWHDERWMSWTPFTYPFNITQQPAASVPCGRTSAGLPIGLQVVGPRFADAAVLAACAAYEATAG